MKNLYKRAAALALAATMTAGVLAGCGGGGTTATVLVPGCGGVRTSARAWMDPGRMSIIFFALRGLKLELS